MIFLSSLIIAAVLFFLEASFLPHLLPLSIAPLLILPFISILSLKDRTIYPIFLGGMLGIVTDSISGNQIPIYFISYLLIVLVSKVFLTRFISYGEFRANLLTVTIGMSAIYLVDITSIYAHIQSWAWLTSLVISIFTTYLVLALYLWVGQAYFTWLEKETEERFR